MKQSKDVTSLHRHPQSRHPGEDTPRADTHQSRHPWEQTPPIPPPTPWEQTPLPMQSMLGDTVNMQAVHILLECILV